jgi:gamma-glutamyltranspeptidase/glutathione hydrolase
LIAIVSLFAATGALAQARQDAQVATGARGMVVCQQPLASRVGLEVLKSGGNAIDAAVAAASKQETWGAVASFSTIVRRTASAR